MRVESLALVPKGNSTTLPLDTVLKRYCAVIGLIDFIWLMENMKGMNCQYLDKVFNLIKNSSLSSNRPKKFLKNI